RAPSVAPHLLPARAGANCCGPPHRSWRPCQHPLRWEYCAGSLCLLGDLQPDLSSIGEIPYLFGDVARCSNQLGSVDRTNVVEGVCAAKYAGNLQAVAPSGGWGSECCARLVDKGLHSPIYPEALVFSQYIKGLTVGRN